MEVFRRWWWTGAALRVPKVRFARGAAVAVVVCVLRVRLPVSLDIMLGLLVVVVCRVVRGARVVWDLVVRFVVPNILMVGWGGMDVYVEVGGCLWCAGALLLGAYAGTLYCGLFVCSEWKKLSSQLGPNLNFYIDSQSQPALR